MANILFKGLTFNNRPLTIGNMRPLIVSSTPPEPPGPVIEEVTIGSYTWTAKNITIDDGEGGIYTHTVNYGQGDVVEYYYTWNAARRIAGKVEGWHLPTDEEIWYLKAAGQSTAAAALRSTYGWGYDNGTNTTGFNVFPAGYILTGNGTLNQLGNFAYIWIDSYQSSIDSAEQLYIGRTNVGMDTGWNEPNVYAYSLRLVKDATNYIVNGSL